MLSLDLSKNSIQNRIERTLKVNLWFLSKFTQELSAKVYAEEKVEEVSVKVTKPSLKIAKTVYPDDRVGFNQTFQHIRAELDRTYKESNPIYKFDEISDDDAKIVKINTDRYIAKPIEESVKEFKPKVYRNSVTATHNIASTAYPDVRPGFNETFLHIKSELDSKLAK